MEASESCERITAQEDSEGIEVTPNSGSDQCSEKGDSLTTLKKAESDGLVLVKSAIGSSTVSEGMNKSRLNMNNALDSRDFEFDVSGLNAQAIGSPADELFYKGQLLPLHAPLRIQMLEKLECPEIIPFQKNVLGAYAGTQTENISNGKKISTHRSGIDKNYLELGFHTPKYSDVTRDKNISSNYSIINRSFEELRFHNSWKTSDVSPYKVGKHLNQTDNNGSPPASDRGQFKELVDSNHSQQKTLNKLKASKAYLRSLISKVSNAKGASDHHSQNSINIQKDNISIQESYDDDEAAAVHRRITGDKSRATHRKCFSGSFSFIKESLLVPKPNLNSVSSPGRESPATSGAPLKGSMRSSNSEIENPIQGAIAHCKKSHSNNRKNMIYTA